MLERLENIRNPFAAPGAYRHGLIILKSSQDIHLTSLVGGIAHFADLTNFSDFSVYESDGSFPEKFFAVHEASEYIVYDQTGIHDALIPKENIYFVTGEEREKIIKNNLYMRWLGNIKPEDEPWWENNDRRIAYRSVLSSCLANKYGKITTYRPPSWANTSEPHHIYQVASMLSLGRIDIEDVPKAPKQDDALKTPDIISPKIRSFLWEAGSLCQITDLIAKEKARVEDAIAVLDIWERVCDEYGVTLKVYDYAENAFMYDEVEKLGRRLGVDNALSLYFERGIPTQDIIL